MLSRLKSLPLTIVLTILIWMYAEAQFTSTRDDVQVSVKLLAPRADVTVRALDAHGTPMSFANIIATIQGPKNQIDRIFEESQRGVLSDEDLASLSYAPPLESLPIRDGARGSEESTVDTVAMLNSLPYFRQRQVLVTAAVPARIRLDVDTMVDFSKPIDFRPSVTVTHFTLAPDQVIVSVPSRTLQQIGGADKITVVAIGQRDLATLPPDTEQSVGVRYSVEYAGPRDERISVKPATGQVALRLPRRQGITEVVPDVPVWVAGPPGLLARYDVELRTKFLRVTVAGSPPAIEALRQRIATSAASANIRAFLDINADDRPTPNVTTRRLRYVLPEGLTLQEGAADVAFRLVERPGPAPATASQPAVEK